MPHSTTHYMDDRTFADQCADRIREGVAASYTPGQLYEIDELRTYVAENSEPDDVFTRESLGQWAIENGYIPKSQVLG